MRLFAALSLLFLGSSTNICLASSADDPAKPGNTQPETQHIFGDWGGLRTSLATKGIDLSLGYIGQLAANVSGGKRAGFDYAQQLEFKADFDWGKIANLSGFSTHAIFVNRLGRNLSSDYIGDNVFQAQSMYGGGGNVVVHLAELYGEQAFLGGKVDVAAGRLLVGEDYATSPLYCDFMSTAVCGYPNSLAAKAGFTTFPNSTWGARVRVAALEHLYVQAGAYQVRPEAGGNTGLNWGWSGTTGTYYPFEVGYEPAYGSSRLNGHYKLGFVHDTSNYPDLLEDENGLAFAETGNPAAMHNGRNSLYFLADQMLYRSGQKPEDGLILLGGFVSSDKSTSQFSRFAFFGLTDQGIIASRPDDSFGVLVAWQEVSDALAATQALQAANGMPLEKSAQGIQSHESLIEARYNIAVSPGLAIMPDVQYVVHPDAARVLPNSVVVGIQMKANL
ncbi:MAG TPA: carbohydrate porin [Micropepsaceae bacterium]|jgi:porin|nr:carbohydrate porin [Micropepsaceae bacterium]